MPLIINNIISSINEDHKAIIEKAIKKARLSKSNIAQAQIHKISLDARKQNNIKLVSSVYIELNDDSKKLEEEISTSISGVTFCENSVFTPKLNQKNKDKTVAVIGFGPAGMFSALALSEVGIKVIVIERGEQIEERVKTVEGFHLEGEFNPLSNVQFGEGGAGTFSDGKLTSRIKDKLCRYILKRFIEFGAPKEIMTKAKAHIGTDNLREVVKNIRQEIIKNGGEIHFNTTLIDIKISGEKVKTIVTDKFEREVDDVILAIGHSARDTFEMIANKDIFIEPKPFSVGVRIEHKQVDVNKSLYGSEYENPLLPQGEYQLSHRNAEGRAVYTFCMCPGGYVVPSSSEENTIVTNGMSYFKRDGENANSALVVSVTPDDFGKEKLSGMYFQRVIEQKAFTIAGGNYKAPATTVKGFLNDKASLDTNINPTYSRGLTATNLNDLFPDYINKMLVIGLNVFSRKMQCFGNENAIMTAPETRTSSPIRITRNEDYCSLNVKNLYPCGEGAGYAGGIMSSAVDGLNVAKAIIEGE